MWKVPEQVELFCDIRPVGQSLCDFFFQTSYSGFKMVAVAPGAICSQYITKNKKEDGKASVSKKEKTFTVFCFCFGGSGV
jgi:hypothetical protein